MAERVVAASAVRLRQVLRAARELEGGHLERVQGEGVCGALPFNKQQTLTMLANSNQWPAAVPSLAGRLASSPLMLFMVLSISKDHEAEVYSNSNARSRVGCILRSDPSFLVMAPLVEALHMATCHFSPMTLQWLSETAQGP